MIFGHLSSIAALGLVSLGVHALPHELEPRASDPAFSVSEQTLADSVYCPNGTDAAGGIVFLVHGTGSTGKESWSFGPYTQILPHAGPGYSACWVTLPNRSQGDAQVSSEYVAYNINALAAKSKTGKVNVIGHSQGNLNIQWALNYFPSTRDNVENFISLAGDLHGTDEGPFLCTTLDLLQRGCTPATRQQSTGSNFLKALLKRGDQALVPTLSIWTRYDEVIQNEQGPNATSRLNGAENHAIQDLDICGPLELAEHFSMIVEPAAFSLAMARIVPNTKFSKYYCNNYIFGTGFNKNTLVKLADTVGAIALDVSSFIIEPATRVEPPLKPYVCAAGDATKCA